MDEALAGAASGSLLDQLGDGLSSSGIAAVLTDAGGGITWSNRAFDALVRDALPGPPSGALVDDLLTSAFDSDAPGTTGVVSPRDASDRFLRMLSAPWEGATLRLYVDCTVEIRGERERRRHELYLSRGVEESYDAILSIDTAGVIRYWNRGAERMFEYTADEVVGRPYVLLVPQDLREEGELERIEEILRQQGALRNFETVRLARGGRPVEVDLTVTVMRDSSGGLLGRSIIYRDISLRRHLQEQVQVNVGRLEAYKAELFDRLEELRLANQALRENQRRLIAMEKLSAIGEMAAKVAHEIRQPLVTIGGFSQTLLKDVEADPSRKRYLEIIRDEVRRLENIVAEILDYVKPEMRMESCDANEMVEGELLRHLPVIKSAGITVERRLGDGLPPVQVNRDQIHQVLTNLIINAVQAMKSQRSPWKEPAAPGQDRLTLSTEAGDNHVRVSIADTGPGIPEGHRQRIFESFFSTKPEGSGLGLAIAARIAALNHATLTFDSEEGGGTVFRLCLPTRRESSDDEDDLRG